MADGTVDFGVVEQIAADAVGVPGQRRFRLQAASAAGYAQLWVEREQTQALGLALEQLLVQIQLQRNEAPVETEEESEPTAFPAFPTVEFTVGRIGLGYDEDHDLIVHQLANKSRRLRRGIPLPDEGRNRSRPSSSLHPAAGRGLKEQCEATLAAGRPVSLSGARWGLRGTLCVRSNGPCEGYKRAARRSRLARAPHATWSTARGLPGDARQDESDEQQHRQHAQEVGQCRGEEDRTERDRT